MIGAPPRTHGFTLVEVLAAAALLGIVATAAVPLLQRVGAAHRAQDRAEAAAWLSASGLRPKAGKAGTIPGHPDWTIRSESMPLAAAQLSGPARQAWRLEIRDRGDDILAQTVVVVPVDAVPAPGGR